MPVPVFNPPVAPTRGPSRQPEVNLREATFGDGYTLAMPAGLNHIRQIVTLRWDTLTVDQMRSLEAFFVERGGYQPFTYRPYGYLAALTWTCRERSGDGAVPATFEAKLRQHFGVSA